MGDDLQRANHRPFIGRGVPHLVTGLVKRDGWILFRAYEPGSTMVTVYIPEYWTPCGLYVCAFHPPAGSLSETGLPFHGSTSLYLTRRMLVVERMDLGAVLVLLFRSRGMTGVVSSEIGLRSPKLCGHSGTSRRAA